jgi:hypothetical protein
MAKHKNDINDIQFYTKLHFHILHKCVVFYYNSVYVLCVSVYWLYICSVYCSYSLCYRAIQVRSPAGAEDFPVACESRPALELTQPPVQWVPEVLSPGVNCGRGMHLVARRVPKLNKV